MRSIVIIAINTFRESVRDKILYNLLLFAAFIMGMSVLLADLTIMEHHRIVMDIGLASINLVGVMIAVFVGIGLVSKEIERRTIYTIMARPISRAQFMLGKYCGLSCVLMLNLVIMAAIFLAMMLVYRAPVHPSLLQAIQLILVELLLVTAAAMFFSTFTSSALSASFTIGVYIIGHLTTDMKGVADKSKNEAIKLVMNGLYYLCPNLEMLNIKGQAAAGKAVPLSYQALTSLYGLLYAAMLIAAACWVFQRRDF
jgi:ABC-type transport system involved in multi-copper enzyme maturation permease subunit